MVGQSYAKAFISHLLDDEMPRFMLIVGDPGSGRKTSAQYIADCMHCASYTVPDVKIATVREIINDSYHRKTPMVYIFPDIDDMSKEAQNSILKITEEPPNKAYFIMTVQDVNNILPTIKSRAFTIFMDKYTKEEIQEYIRLNHHTLLNSDINIASICETPGEVETFVKCGGEDFYKFVDKVVDNVDNVSTANALKILDSLDIKSEGAGFDSVLFLKIFIRICMSRASIEFNYNKSQQYIKAVFPTSQTLARIKLKGANKNMLLVNWIFDVRNVYGIN